MNRRSSDRITAREVLWVSLLGVVLALVSHWPLPLHLGDAFSRDLGDPIVQAWQVAWGGHALATQPTEFFQANQFWPLPDSLAFSDALIGYAPAGLIGDGVEAATVRYNLLFLFAYALAFVGAYLLARELRVRPAAALVAGAAFAYAPWRLEQDGHLHVISSGAIALSLYLLLRGYRGGRAGMVLAGWLAAAWQVSLGFTLGLQLGYLLAAAAIVAGVVWWRAGRPAPPRRVIAASAAGVLALAVVAVTLSLPYQRVLDAHPEAERSAERVARGSGPLWQFVSAPQHNMVWGEATRQIREDHLTSIPEQTLFPGLVIAGLALLGALGGAMPRAWRIGLACAAVTTAILSLGFRTSGVGQFLPYRLLYEFAPGWEGVRTPGRLNTLTSLALALLAAGGAQRAIESVQRRADPLAARRAAAAVAAALVILICVEASGFEIAPASGGAPAGSVTPRAPRAPAGQEGIAQPQLHLPVTIAANRRYVYWSTAGFPKILNGRASIDPRFFAELTRDVAGFPDRRSLARLRAAGVETVVLHPYLLPGTVWQGATERSIEGLGVTRRARGDLVVFELG